MRDAGYDETTAKNPKNLTESDGYKVLMNQYLSDETLAKAHGELLDAASIERLGFQKEITDEQIEKIINKVPGCKVLHVRRWKDTDSTAYVQVLDNNARKNALDMAYKLKGRYGEEAATEP